MKKILINLSKENNMYLGISIFFVILLAFWTSKVKICIQNFSKNQAFSKIHFHVKLGFYLFGFIKIGSIRLRENGIFLFGFRFAYNKLKINKDSIKMVTQISVLEVLKSLHLKLEHLKIDLKIGCEDVMLTVFLVFAISTFLSIFGIQNRKQIKREHFHYQITPIYNRNFLDFELSSQISLKMYDFIKTVLSIQKFTKPKKQPFFLKKVPMKI